MGTRLEIQNRHHGRTVFGPGGRNARPRTEVVSTNGTRESFLCNRRTTCCGETKLGGRNNPVSRKELSERWDRTELLVVRTIENRMVLCRTYTVTRTSSTNQ